MGWFIVLIGALFMVEGAALVLVPRKVLHIANKMLAIKDAKLLGWIPLTIGVLLCISARYSYMALAIFLLGLLAIAKGLYMFVTPIEKIKKNRWFTLSEKAYRVIGLVVLIIGMLVVNAAM
jgi:uncharacterized protein YjeT (DUF2065 family)